MDDFFLPRKGIDREVINAHICDYLGADAFVKSGLRYEKASAPCC